MYRSYFDLDYRINFWRTKSGLEVDFVLDDGQIAIEVKGRQRDCQQACEVLFKKLLRKHDPIASLIDVPATPYVLVCRNGREFRELRQCLLTKYGS